MYPLNAILISPGGDLLPRARCELWNQSVHIEYEFTSPDEAISTLRKASVARRLLVLHMDAAEELDALARLTSRYPGWPVVALMEGYDPKASLGEVVVGFMRAGASEILSLPIPPEDLKVALERIAVQFVYAAKETKVIAVAGVTGGSGATTIALNLAYEIAIRRRLRCVLVDLSLRMGVVASHLNIEPRHSINDLLRDTSRIDTYMIQQVLEKVAENFEILPGPPHLAAPVSASSQDVGCVLKALKQMTDVIVLDVPCTYDALYFETLAAADQVILIGEQKLPSIRALKMVREAIAREGGTEFLVLNRYDPKIKGFEIDQLKKPLAASTLHSVARDDVGMSAAMDEAKTLRLGFPRSPALADIGALIEVMLPLETPPHLKPEGLFRRLGRALSNS